MLSRRFEAEVSVDAFTVYRALGTSTRRPTCSSSGWANGRSSVRRLKCSCASEGRHAVTHPIAGTRPRGKTDEEDMRLAEELKRNEKERAEHVMLVDLGRNDIGRVCDYGTVRVPTFMTLERYSHVMHMVSVVEGQLAEGAIGSMRWYRVSGRHRVRRAESARHADHQRARADAARFVCRRRRLSRLRRQPRFLHRHPFDLLEAARPTSSPAAASSPTRTRRRNSKSRGTRRAR